MGNIDQLLQLHVCEGNAVTRCAFDKLISNCYCAYHAPSLPCEFSSLTRASQDPNTAICCRFRLLFVERGYRSLQREAADGVFADAAEIEGAVAFDDVGDFGEAVGGAVLEVFDDTAL